jgi:cephalosporin hydroxylase
VVEDLPAGSFPDRPWDIGNNPKTAVHEWLKSYPEFEIDKDIDNNLLISVAPDGYLKRIRQFKSSSETSAYRRLCLCKEIS